ncbi:MAG TPA: glycosyltransferase family 9 protein [Azonexus sp.]|nr:glycosyltransferase family 9 protein [Azonexus sp.]
MTRYNSLVIYRKQLGDVLLLQPALEKLAGDGSVALATRSGFADLLALMPGPVSQASEWFPRASQVYCLESRRGALAYAATCFGARRTLLLTKDEAPWWQKLIFAEQRIESGGSSYRAELFYRLFGGQADEFRPPRLKVPPADWQLAGLPANYVVIHPTSAWQRKTWASGRWVEALREQRGNFSWVVSSGQSAWEVELASEVAAGLGERAINLAGKTNLRQYLALLAGARCTLCVDGSASHLSAAFGKPTLTLFGPTNPAHWHWQSPTTPRLWAADFTGESKPRADAIPVRAVSDATAHLLELAHV